MKRFFAIFILAFVALSGTLVSCGGDNNEDGDKSEMTATPWTPETLPLPKNTTDSLRANYVTNPDGILTSTEVDSINNVMFNLEQSKGVRGLIVAVKAIEPDDPFDFTLDVFNNNGVGGKSNTGFVMMVASESRCYFTMTGEKLEIFLTDADCARIGRHDMEPLLKEGKWGQAILAGLHRIQGICSGEEELSALDDEDEDGDVGSVLMWIGGGFAGLFGLGYYAARKSRQCPKCKKHNYRQVLRRTVLAEDGTSVLTTEEMDALVEEKMLEIRADKLKKLRESGEKTLNSLSSNKDGDAEVEATSSPMSDKKDKKDGSKSQLLYRAEQEEIKKQKTAEDAMARNNKGKYRKVHVIDVCLCSDCGYEGHKQKSGTTYNYALGIFTTGAFGAIMHASSSSGSGSYRSGGGRSSGGGHSWGSFGGGRSGGGGAGGRF